MKFNKQMFAFSVVLLSISPYLYAAISLDRTRVIYPGNEKSMTLSIQNGNKNLPFLAQAWIEDSKGQKLHQMLTVVPPLQRVEPDAISQLTIKELPGSEILPQDRESLFYFNVREIPPKSKKPNTLQLALQTKIKLFYRPKSLQLTPEQMKTPWQDKLTLLSSGDGYTIKNPTPYYITIVSAQAGEHGKPYERFSPLMLEPFGEATLGITKHELGSVPVLTYINDYGGAKDIVFSCDNKSCSVKKDLKASL